MRTLFEQFPDFVIPSFGLHPWRIQAVLQQRQQCEPPDQATAGTSSGGGNGGGGGCCVGGGAWASELEAHLQKYPGAGVGECGLDKAIVKQVPLQQQEEILRFHLQLAASYNRPITLHCVGCWDRLPAVLKQKQKEETGNVKRRARKTAANVESISSSEAPHQQQPPASASNRVTAAAIILHSCNSLPKEMVAAFTKLPLNNVYYSVAAGRTALSPKLLALVATIPPDRLLLETDSPDQLSAALAREYYQPQTTHAQQQQQCEDNSQSSTFTVQNSISGELALTLSYNEPALVRQHCITLAAALKMVPSELAQRTLDNARRAFLSR